MSYDYYILNNHIVSYLPREDQLGEMQNTR
jgi:hypothetical protein